MKLIEDARNAWKWFSVQAMAVSIILLGAWGVMPDDLKSSLPDWTLRAIAIMILVLGLAGRLVQQGPVPPQKEDGQ